MGLFRWRRPVGRHAAPAAGAAVPAPAAPWDAGVWEPTPSSAEAPAAPSSAESGPQPVVPAQPSYPVGEPALPAQGPRVELGFRDGSTTALAPDSAQARALSAIADVLTRRD